MKLRRSILPPSASALLGLCLSVSAAARTHAVTSPLTPRQQAAQALDRLTYGARPGEVDAVERMGVSRWIDQQLHPEHIDDSALDARLAVFPAMQLSTAELLQRFPAGPVIRQMDAGRMPMALPADPVEHAIYANALANYRAGKARQAQGAEGQPDPAVAQVTQAQIAGVLALAPAARWNAVLHMQPGTVRPLVQRMNPQQRSALGAGLTVDQREAIEAMVAPQRVVTSEMEQSMLLREVYSERQLDEVMTGFWANHFSIYLRKNEEMPWALATYERDVIRPHALGHFEDLLNAVAHSPAMLVFLDNQQSIGPDSPAALSAGARGGKASDGLNENYARELMELHTLGVNGGYTQQDVIALAKVLTGWGVLNPRQGYGFQFNPRRHEPGTKVVLGHSIPQGGEAEGEQMLHILAESPATARFLSAKLATEFVSDTPPPALVDRMTKSYLRTHGDIRAVMSTMLRSPEFWSRGAYRAKLKTPLEFEVSALRATDAQIDNADALVAMLDRMGMPYYGVQQPNGYSLTADAWLGAGSLLTRMNFALALTADRIPGVRVGNSVALSEATTEPVLEQTLLDGEVSADTHQAVLRELAAPPQGAGAAVMRTGGGRGRDMFAPRAGTGETGNSGLAAALLLGSPDFQRR